MAVGGGGTFGLISQGFKVTQERRFSSGSWMLSSAGFAYKISWVSVLKQDPIPAMPDFSLLVSPGEMLTICFLGVNMCELHEPCGLESCA